MRLARYAAAGETWLGRIDGDSIVDLLAEAPGPDLLVRYLDGDGSDGARRALADVRLLAPLARPGKILCIGLNYLDHCRETGDRPPVRPLLFSKYANTIVGPGEAIHFDPADSAEVDWEVELVAVIGRRCRRVSEADALAHVAGYTVGNDVSARDAQFGDGQWVRGKTFDTFFPLGPWVVTGDELGDPAPRAIRSRVSGELMQDSTTGEMIFGVAELVSYLSRFITLEPGDLIATGTPWGVGYARKPPRYLRDGDTVEVEVEGVGSMFNPVEARASG